MQLATHVKDLQARGLRIGKERIRKLMVKHGIRAKTKRKFIVPTDKKHNLPIAPNQLLCGDITYITIGEDWLYLAAAIDMSAFK